MDLGRLPKALDPAFGNVNTNSDSEFWGECNQAGTGNHQVCERCWLPMGYGTFDVKDRRSGEGMELVFWRGSARFSTAGTGPHGHQRPVTIVTRK